MIIGLSRQIFENTQTSKHRLSLKIRPVGLELFHADGQTVRQTDRYDKAYSSFSQFCERI